MGDKILKSWEVPATKWDVARVAAEATLAIREIVSCVLMAKMGKDDELKDRIEDLSKRADEMWALFSEMTKVSDD
jgi:hypothetical protein